MVPVSPRLQAGPIKTTCFLADMGDFAAFNEVYAKYFTSKPARSCVAVKSLPKGLLWFLSAQGSRQDLSPYTSSRRV